MNVSEARERARAADDHACTVSQMHGHARAEADETTQRFIRDVDRLARDVLALADENDRLTGWFELAAHEDADTWKNRAERAAADATALREALEIATTLLEPFAEQPNRYRLAPSAWERLCVVIKDARAALAAGQEQA